jgi:hypothetical protein
MYKETVQAVGTVVIELRDSDGQLKTRYEDTNLIVTAGRAYLASRLLANTAAVISHIGVGDSNTAAAALQTDLQAATNKVRVATSSATNVTTNVANDSAQYVATFPAGTASWALTEAGLFNAASAGTMLSRIVFPVINKGSNDSLTITWKIVMLGNG